jgi:uncharacterized membrane protein
LGRWDKSDNERGKRDATGGCAESSFDRAGDRFNRLVETIRRAFAEFLKLPALIVFAFLAVAAITSVLDFAEIGWLRTIRVPIREHIFRNSEATSELLGTIAGSIITVTSITFSLLLLAVQQAASALTHQVYDQFLRRRINQGYFGFFVGLAVYTLVILATVDRPYNPVFGAAIALVLTVIALMLLIVLLYTTINQMRPVVVIETIHNHVLAARDCQRDWLRKVHDAPRMSGSDPILVRAATHGYVTRVDVDALKGMKTNGEVEVVLRMSVGTYAAFQDTLAEVRAGSPQDAEDVAEAARSAIRLEQQRDLDTDAAYGIEQLAIIGWTSVSTAKSNPSPGLLVVHSLRDLMARWSAAEANPKADMQADCKVSVIYRDDVVAHLLDAFGALAVVASESMQPQTLAEIARTFDLMFNRLPAQWQPKAEDLIRRSLSALGEHVLTSELDDALSGLVRALTAAGRVETAAEILLAQKTLASSIGKLGSRATRVPKK